MQFVDINAYHALVDQFGIEVAYQQRFRRTGRTVRDALALATKLSLGEDIVLIPENKPGKQHMHCRDVLRVVEHICRELGMDVTRSIDGLTYKPSNGQINILSGNRRGLRNTPKEYKLHDC